MIRKVDEQLVRPPELEIRPRPPENATGFVVDARSAYSRAQLGQHRLSLAKGPVDRSREEPVEQQELHDE